MHCSQNITSFVVFERSRVHKVPSNRKHNKQQISPAMKYLYSDMCSSFYKQIYYVHSKPSTFSNSTTTITQTIQINKLEAHIFLT